jgi:hypothetical protein
MNRAKAIQIARSGDFRGCEIHELELIVKLTGSKKAVSELARRISRYGNFVKDEHGNLRR